MRFGLCHGWISDEIVADIEARDAGRLGRTTYSDFVQAPRAITSDDMIADE